MERYTPSRAHRIAEHRCGSSIAGISPEGAERQVAASAAVTRDPSKREPDRPLLAKKSGCGGSAVSRKLAWRLY